MRTTPGPLLLHLNYLGKNQKPEASSGFPVPTAKVSARDVRSLVKEVQRVAPNKTVATVSSPEVSINLDQAQIVIATNRIFSFPEITFETAIIVNPDIGLNRPNPDALSQLRFEMLKIAGRSEHLLIQTSQPDHYIFRTLHDFKAFYEQEIENRKTFSYPPFAELIKVTIKADSESEAKQKLQKVRELLALHSLQYFDLPAKARKNYWQLELLLKVQPDAQIDKTLKKLYGLVQIEINPYQIF